MIKKLLEWIRQKLVRKEQQPESFEGFWVNKPEQQYPLWVDAVAKNYAIIFYEDQKDANAVNASIYENEFTILSRAIKAGILKLREVPHGVLEFEKALINMEIPHSLLSDWDECKLFPMVEYIITNYGLGEPYLVCLDENTPIVYGVDELYNGAPPFAMKGMTLTDEEILKRTKPFEPISIAKNTETP